MTLTPITSEAELLFQPDQPEDSVHSFSFIGGLSLVIPLRVIDLSCLSGFKDHYDTLLRHMDQIQDWEFTIVDASPDGIFAIIDDWFVHQKRVFHIRPAIQDIPGHNNKLLSLMEALSRAQYRYALLLDHDMRPSFQSLCAIVSRLPAYDCARCMIHYQALSVIGLVNVNGIFLINLLCRDKQFWGHLILNRETLLALGFPPTCTLFDELTITRHFQKHGKRVGYFPTIIIPMAYRDSLSRFFEQRLRYAYENLAYPGRFSLFLSILPLLLACAFISPWLSLVFFGGITCIVLVLGYVGQKRYGNGFYPPLAFLCAPLWFWPYPFTSWIALALYLKGGVQFGGQTIRRPA